MIIKTTDVLIICVALLIICFGAGHSYAKEKAAQRKHEYALTLFEYARYESRNQRYEIVADVFGCY